MITKLFIFVIFITSIVASNIVDFSYTEYVHNRRNQNSQNQLSIRPSSENSEDYEFPNGCEIMKKISDDHYSDLKELEKVDFQTMVENLKSQFIQLLRISEKMRKKKSNINELGTMWKQNKNSTQLAGEDLERLKKYQANLRDINEKIAQTTQNLQELVYDSIQNSQSNQFLLTAYNFQIQSLVLKLQYLKKQKQSSQISQKTDQSDDAFEKYFQQLRDKFDEENQLVQELNQILKNYDEIAILKTKVSKLKGEIELADLMIEEKQGCAKQKKQIQQFQRNQTDIKNLMATLRERKKQNTKINNKYCEGVAKKLEDRVKKVLMAYDYIFECAEGLEQIRIKRESNEQDYNNCRVRLRELEKNIGMDEYKKKFEQNRKYINTKNQEIKQFKIAQYYHNVEDLEKLIQKTEKQLADLREKKGKMDQSSPNKKNIDYAKIQEFVDSIKKLKGMYCFQYEQYENLAHSVYGRIQRAEADHEFQSKINTLYYEEISQLRELQKEFNELRGKIIERIK